MRIVLGAMGLVAVAALLAGEPETARSATLVTDSAELTAAINTAQSGDTIVVQRGDYVGPFNVVAKSGLTIKGRGKPTFTTTLGNAFEITSSDNITLKGLVMDGLQSKGVEIVTSSDVTITKCQIRNTGGDGVQSEGSQRVTISKCRFEDIGDDAISLQENGTTPTSDSTVTKNRIARTNGSGVRLVAAGTTVSKNRIESVTEHGVIVRPGIGTGDNVVTRNKISGISDCGILAQADRTEVSRNKLVDVEGDALDLEGDGSAAIRNNVSGASTGVDAGADDLTVERNLLRGILLDAVSVSGDAVTVFRNAAIAPGRDGYRVRGESTGSTLERNFVVKAGRHGFSLEGGGNTLLQNKAKRSAVENLLDESGGGNTLTNNDF